MKKGLLITLGSIIVVVALSIFIDLPKSPLWGNRIKAMLGLDLVGGTELIYQADLSQSQDKAKDLDNLASVFRSRIDELGVSEPNIQTTGSDRILIELPGIKNIDQAISKIGATYELVFMTESTKEEGGVQLNDYYDSDFTYPGYWKKTELTGRDLKQPSPADITFQNDQSGLQSDPVTTIKFNNVGKEKFSNITSANLQKRIAIALDDKIVSAPTVQSEITNGEAIITGASDIKDAQKLAKRLNEGALPVSANLIGQRNVGATLGQDSLKNSAVAGIIGLLLVSIFMVLYYKTSGFVAVIALAIYSVISLAIYKLIPVTLSLAGIAGFVLSIGMAIDANILIFERMREELRSGKVLNLAIVDGFKRAWNSVRDSNFSSIITCIILYYISGSGPVKGFALTLAIGVLVSLFTAITVTRTILLLISGTKLKRFIHV